MSRNSGRQARKDLLEQWAIEALREIGSPDGAPARVVVKLVFSNHFFEILQMGLFFDYDYDLRWAASESEKIVTNKSTRRWMLA